MANSKKFVVKNGLETQNIQFVEADGTETITLTVLEDGSLSFSGSSGQLFSIADSLTGTIFSVNDISGIPSIEVFDDGKVILAESTGNVGIGTASPTEKLEVSGTIKATALTLTGGLTVAGDLTVNGTTTNINTTNLVVEDKNIILGDVTTPSDITADGGGITLKGASDKTITWVDSTDRWTSNQVFGAPNFVSTVATGTQPYATTSTTANTNLNADLLDGKHLMGGNTWDRIPIVGSDGVMEIGKYIDFHDSSGDTGDYATRLNSNGNTLTTSGTFTATQLISNIAIGTPPLIVTSTTVVTNLNADLLDGLDSSSFQRQIDESIVAIGSPATSSGTWTTADTDDWGTPRIGSEVARYNDNDGMLQYNVPAGMDTAYISHLTWSSGGYVDAYGVQADGGLVFLRRINTRQAVENSNEGSNGGNPNQHDGSTITLVGTGLSTYSAIRLQNRNGRFHLTGMSFTSAKLQGTEGTGMVHPAQLSLTGASSGLDADLLDGNHASAFVLKAGDTMTGTLNIQAGNNTYGLSTGLSLRLGLDTADKAGAIRLDGTTDGAYGLIQETDSNLHIDAVGGKTYINYYDGDAVMFGSGASSVVAVMGPDGDLWKGSADNTGSVYWHAGNDGAGSGLDADLIDGISFRNGNSTNGISPDNINENGTGYITSVSLYGQTDGALYSQAYNTSWVHQIYGDYRTGSLAVRGRNNGTLTSWRTVWDSGNDGAGSTLDADLLDGNHAAAFATASHTHGDITSAGAITSTVVTPVNGDNIIIADSSASDVLKRGITIGTSTDTFLRNDGSWSNPRTSGKIYSSLTGSSTQWFDLFTIGDASNGALLVSIHTYAHGDLLFAVSSGYGPSAVATITILNCVYNPSGGYAQLEGIRVTDTGLVQIQLAWSSGPIVDIEVSIFGQSTLPTLAASLTANTTSYTINDTVSLSGLQGKIRSENGFVSGTTDLLTEINNKEPLDNTIIHKIGTITNQDWNTYIDGTEASWVAVSGHSGSNRPSSSYTYGLALNAATVSEAKFQLYAPETGSSGNGLWYRTGWNATYRAWVKIWDSGNDGTGSTLDADLLDGQEGTYYLNYNNFTNTPTIPTVNDATLTLATSGTGLSGSATFTANDADNVTFTVTSNATNANTASTIVARDSNKAFQVNKIYFANNAADAYISGDATDQYKIWFGSDAEGQSIYIDTLNQEFVGPLSGTASGNLTSSSTLTAGNLSGTIPSAVLGNSSLFVGTTSIALNRTSGSQTLTGVSIDGSAASATSATTATTATNANNINISTTSGNTSDTTMYPVLVGANTTGNQAPHTDISGLSYNASTNILYAAGGFAVDPNGGVTTIGTGGIDSYINLKADGAGAGDTGVYFNTTTSIIDNVGNWIGPIGANNLISNFLGFFYGRKQVQLTANATGKTGTGFSSISPTSLTVTLPFGQYWKVRAVLRHQVSVNESSNVGYSVTIGSTASSPFVIGDAVIYTSTTAESRQLYSDASTTVPGTTGNGILATQTTINTPRLCVFDFIVYTGTATNKTFTVNQRSGATSTLTTLAGSYIEAWRIS